MGQVDKQRQSDRANSRNTRHPANSSWGQDEFINYELSSEQSRACSEWRQDADNVMNLLSEMVENGYKITQKWDGNNNCPVCYVFPGPDTENSGFILTGRGSTAFRAVAQAIYKHYEVFHGDWSNARTRVYGGSGDDF